MTYLSRQDFQHIDTVPTADFRFIALDVETERSNAASICQIGIACVQPDNRVQTFSLLVDPRTRFDEFNIRLHGIGPDHVSDAPSFSDAFSALIDATPNRRYVH